jgi:hypothetical protein
VQGFHDRQHYRIELLEFLKAHGSITASAARLAAQKSPASGSIQAAGRAKNPVLTGDY